MHIVRSDYSTLDGAVEGVIAGLRLAAGAAVTAPASELGSPWLPLNLIGAVLDQSWARFDGFHSLATPYGLFAHLIVSLRLGVLVAWASSRSILWATFTGGLVGGLFWLAAQTSWLPMVNPAHARAVPDELMLAGHLAFGFMVGAYLDVRGRTSVVDVRRAGRRRAVV